MPGQQHDQPTPTSLGQRCICVFRCNLPPALLADQPGSFTCHCDSTGVEQTLNKSQHTKLTLEKKTLLPLLPGFELATFQSQVWHSNQQAIPDPVFHCMSIQRFYQSAECTGQDLFFIFLFLFSIKTKICRHL